jgi:hypothetical protein
MDMPANGHPDRPVLALAREVDTGLMDMPANGHPDRQGTGQPLALAPRPGTLSPVTTPSTEKPSFGKRVLIYLGLADAPGPVTRNDQIRNAIQTTIGLVIIVVLLFSGNSRELKGTMIVGGALVVAIALWTYVDRRRAARRNGSPPDA